MTPLGTASPRPRPRGWWVPLVRARLDDERGQILPALAVLMVVILAGGLVLFQVGRASSMEAEAVTAADAAALAGAQNVVEQLQAQLAANNGYNPSAVNPSAVAGAAKGYATRNGATAFSVTYDPAELEVRVKVRGNEALDGDAGVDTDGDRAPAEAAAKVEAAFMSSGVPASGFAGKYNGPVAETIYKVGKEKGVSDICMLAAFETAIVESGMQNLNYGDRDSLGVFQQRPSQGWGTPAQVMDVGYAAAKFFDGCMQKSQTGVTPGQLAQSVQISAFPDRYDQVEGQAKAALSKTSQSAGDGGGKGGDGDEGGAPAQTIGQQPSVGGSFGSPSSAIVPGGLQPHAHDMAVAARQNGFGGEMGGVGPRPIPSDHTRGLAIDFMVYQDKQLGDQVAEWALANADRFAVTYVIWYDRIATRSGGGFAWRPYTHPLGATSNPTLRHLDHVHVSVSGDPNGVSGGGGYAPSVTFDVHLIDWDG